MNHVLLSCLLVYLRRKTFLVEQGKGLFEFGDLLFGELISLEATRRGSIDLIVQDPENGCSKTHGKNTKAQRGSNGIMGRGSGQGLPKKGAESPIKCGFFYLKGGPFKVFPCGCFHC
jgi:hypothetical protein